MTTHNIDSTVELYKCKSYEQDGKLLDCTCGRCTLTEELEEETVQENGVITKPSRYEILSRVCLSSKHVAQIHGVQSGNCQCGNCKVKVREHRFHKGAYIGDTSHHDYVFDADEVIKVRQALTPDTK